MKIQNPRQVYGETLVELGRENKDIVVLEADLGKSTMTSLFEEEFPERFFEMGIGEANMTSFAAGLSLTGKIAFTNSFAVFAAGRGIDPRSGAADAVRRFEVAIKDYGCKGLGEVVLQQFQIYPHDKSLYPLYEKCIEFNVPFIGNCEGPSRFTMPKEFEQVAKDFPDLKMCLAGSGRPRKPSVADEPTADAIRLANEYENVYLGIAAAARRDRAGIGMFFHLLRRCFDSDAKSKIMYGSDFPVAVAGYAAKDWIDVIINRHAEFGFSFSDAELTRLFSGNALDFLKDVL